VNYYYRHIHQPFVYWLKKYSVLVSFSRTEYLRYYNQILVVNRSEEWTSISPSERETLGLKFEYDGEFW